MGYVRIPGDNVSQKSQGSPGYRSPTDLYSGFGFEISSKDGQCVVSSFSSVRLGTHDDYRLKKYCNVGLKLNTICSLLDLTGRAAWWSKPTGICNEVSTKQSRITTS